MREENLISTEVATKEYNGQDMEYISFPNNKNDVNNGANSESNRGTINNRLTSLSSVSGSGNNGSKQPSLGMILLKGIPKINSNNNNDFKEITWKDIQQYFIKEWQVKVIFVRIVDDNDDGSDKDYNSLLEDGNDDTDTKQQPTIDSVALDLKGEVNNQHVHSSSNIIVNSEDYNSILKNEESIPFTNLVPESSSTRSKRVGTQKAYVRLAKDQDATF